MPVPRSTAGQARRNSSRVGINRPIFIMTTGVWRCCSRLVTISVMPSNPMAIGTNPMPSESTGMPNVKRCVPELVSVPTSPSSSPRNTMVTALVSEPEASTTAPIRPSTMSEKYSAGPNCSATWERGGLAIAMNNVATVPAKNDPSAATAKAAPARPRCAIA